MWLRSANSVFLLLDSTTSFGKFLYRVEECKVPAKLMIGMK